ncbi:MAG: hypothetical protein U1A78_19280 [Polyangia bacterium]
MPASKPILCLSSKLSPPPIAAVLDLAAPQERAAFELLRRFCTGRWPLWRLLGLRRQGRTLCAAVEWRRAARADRYSVAELSLEACSVCWRYFPSASAARRALRALAEAPQPAQGASV